MYNKNSSGRRFDPCGTPQRTVFVPVTFWFTLQVCLRLWMYDWNHWRAVPCTPYIWNLDISMLWSTTSNAFFKSRNKTPLTRPLSMLTSHWFVELLSSRVSLELSFNQGNIERRTISATRNWLATRYDTSNFHFQRRVNKLSFKRKFTHSKTSFRKSGGWVREI